MSLKEFLTRLGQESHDPAILNAVKSGLVPGTIFAFQVLTTIIFFSALLSVLYYLGIMQKVVMFFARIMAHTMRVSGAEALSNSANIFVGQTEAPLVVRPYLEKMTRSELMAIMVGGFSNTAGGVLGAYILMLVGFFPNIAAHLISASLLSAPAGFIIAKVMLPEKEEPLTRGNIRLDAASEDANILDAAANGSTVGWQLAINVAAMLISFVALIAMVNLFVSWIGEDFHTTSGLIQFERHGGRSPAQFEHASASRQSGYDDHLVSALRRRPVGFDRERRRARSCAHYRFDCDRSMAAVAVPEHGAACEYANSLS